MHKRITKVKEAAIRDNKSLKATIAIQQHPSYGSKHILQRCQGQSLQHGRTTKTTAGAMATPEMNQIMQVTTKAMPEEASTYGEEWQST
eukprot:3906991-Ditylum_brightwellii.AAC.1